MASLYFANQKPEKPITSPSTRQTLGGRGQTVPDTESVASSEVAPMSVVGLLLFDADEHTVASGLTEVLETHAENPSARLGGDSSRWLNGQESPPPNNMSVLNGSRVESQYDDYGVPDPKEGSDGERTVDTSAPSLAPFAAKPYGTGHVSEENPASGSKKSRFTFIAMCLLGLVLLIAACVGIAITRSTRDREEAAPAPSQVPVLSSAPTPFLRTTSSAPTLLPSVKTTDSPTGLQLNDECYEATTAFLGGRYEGSTIFAHLDFAGFTGCSSVQDFLDGPGVWYQIMGTGVPITASTCNGNTDFDTKLIVLSGSCEGNSFSCEAENDDFNRNGPCAESKSRVTWLGTEGTLYYVLLTGWAGNEGNYELSFKE